MRSNLPKISIVTVSFNQGQYLEQAIKSVLDQNYPNLEYIIIDGASTDNSVEIIKKYESQLTYWISERDSGQSEGINKGIAKCTGDIFNWLCSDDFYVGNTLFEVAETFQKTNARIVTGNYRYMYPDGRRGETGKGLIMDNTIGKSIARTSMTQPCTFFRMEDIMEFNGVTNDLNYCMDFELWLKYLIRYGDGQIAYNERILVDYMLHPESKSFKELDNTRFNLSSAFTNEKNAIYLSLAKQIGEQNVIDGLNYVVQKQVLGYELKMKTALPKHVLSAALNYVLYDYSRRFFYAGDYAKSGKILSFVNTSMLEEEDRKGAKYLQKQLLIKNWRWYPTRTSAL